MPYFTQSDAMKDQLSGYDGCFYCAGISSLQDDTKEPEYNRVTYDTTLHFAEVLGRIESCDGVCFLYALRKWNGFVRKGKGNVGAGEGVDRKCAGAAWFRKVYNFLPTGVHLGRQRGNAM